MCAKKVACSLPTRCSQASPARAKRCGGLSVTASSRTWSSMGKPMGNGYPIAGVAVKPDLLETFGKTAGYFNTFGGNPVAAAAGLAVLETLEVENLRENALEVGAYLLAGLEARRPALQPSSATYGERDFTSASSSLRDRKSKTPDRAAATSVVEMLRGPQHPGRHCRLLRQHRQDPPAALLCAGPCRPSRQGAFRLACDPLLDRRG